MDKSNQMVDLVCAMAKRIEDFDHYKSQYEFYKKMYRETRDELEKLKNSAEA